ncbi:MAG: hypothetical protein Q8O67_32905 [Deltaproteobacteria bacterium]|nr:hypothetical protein [Deltaproteobacteria bacterium]
MLDDGRPNPDALLKQVQAQEARATASALLLTSSGSLAFAATR